MNIYSASRDRENDTWFSGLSPRMYWCKTLYKGRARCSNNLLWTSIKILRVIIFSFSFI